jgi:hypothetical protein
VLDTATNLKDSDCTSNTHFPFRPSSQNIPDSFIKRTGSNYESGLGTLQEAVNYTPVIQSLRRISIITAFWSTMIHHGSLWVEIETSREAGKVLTRSKADVFSSVKALITEALQLAMVASLKPQYRKRQVSASPSRCIHYNLCYAFGQGLRRCNDSCHCYVSPHTHEQGFYDLNDITSCKSPKHSYS